MRSLGAVFAPATALSGILLYVGWIRTRAFFAYFGINSAELGFSPQDYILRSADVGAGAVALIALGGGILLVLDRALANGTKRLDQRAPKRVPLQLILAAFGLVLVLAGLWSVIDRAVLAAVPTPSSAGMIAIGAVLLLRFGTGLQAQSALLGARTVGFGLLVLMVTGLWAANSYAQSIGRDAAESIDRDSSNLAVASILADSPLDIPGSLISASRVVDPEGKEKYRYVGGRVLTSSSGKFYLIVDAPRDGYRSRIYTLKDSDSVHVETATPTGGQPGGG